MITREWLETNCTKFSLEKTKKRYIYVFDGTRERSLEVGYDDTGKYAWMSVRYSHTHYVELDCCPLNETEFNALLKIIGYSGVTS